MILRSVLSIFMGTLLHPWASGESNYNRATSWLTSISFCGASGRSGRDLLATLTGIQRAC